MVLVNESANFGFSYYWPHGHITFHHDDSGQGFGTEVAGVDAVYVPTRDYRDVLAGLREALDRWRRAGAGSRLFIVRSHLNPDEDQAWRRAFAALELDPSVLNAGTDPLLVLGPSAAGGS